MININRNLCHFLWPPHVPKQKLISIIVSANTETEMDNESANIVIVNSVS